MISPIIKNFFLDLFFPKTCFGCGRKGTYFCYDCRSITDIIGDHFCLCDKPTRKIKCPNCENSVLDGVHFSTEKHQRLVASLIEKFTNEPFCKELKEPLAEIIKDHFLISGEDLSGFSVSFIPLARKQLKLAGYDPNQELALELKKILNLEEHTKKVLLVGLIFEKEKMEEEAERLKNSGAIEVWATTVCR